MKNKRTISTPPRARARTTKQPFCRRSHRIRNKLRKPRPKRVGFQYKKYDETNLQQAIIAVQCNNMHIRKAAKIFHVPCSSLHSRLQKQCAVNFTDSNLNFNQTQQNTCTQNFQYSIRTILTIDIYARIEVDIIYSSCVNDSINDKPISTIILKSAPSGPATIMTYEEECAFSEWIITCSNLHIPTPKSICSQKASMILERRGAKFNTKTGLPSREWWYGFHKRWPQIAPRKPQSLTRKKAALTKEYVDAFFTDLHSLSNVVATEVSQTIY
jgi:hypothetical protein